MSQTANSLPAQPARAGTFAPGAAARPGALNPARIAIRGLDFY